MSVCLISAIVIAYFTGYDYLIFAVAQPETIYASYGELLVAIILAFSGMLVLIYRDVKIHTVVCCLLAVIQLLGFYFYKHYELTERITVIEWIPLVTSLFSCFLVDLSKEKIHKESKSVSNWKSIIEMLVVVIYLILTVSGMVAIYCKFRSDGTLIPLTAA